jgi:uncharacterized protein YjiS (DUF1127 family)
MAGGCRDATSQCCWELLAAILDAAFLLRREFRMCSSLEEFDVHTRGVVNLVQAWRSADSAARAVWRLEDLTAEWLKLAGKAHELRDYYCEHGQFPNSEATYSYFVEILDGAAKCGLDLDGLICMFEAEGYEVKVADALRRGIDRFHEIIDEDRFATNASFGGGALDEWD